MAPQAPPKALLFDIGGVCVISPFQAILDYEIANKIPPGYVNFTISRNAPHGSWQKLERGEIPLDDAFFAAFQSELTRQDRWEEHWERVESARAKRKGGEKRPAPQMPAIDAKGMFWNMMRMSRSPDPWMYPALKRLRDSGRFVLAALSNTIIFPAGVKDEKNAEFESGLRDDHGVIRELNDAERGTSAEARTEMKEMFDAFVSSAHVGLRKPDPEIYKLAMREMERVAGEKGKGGLKEGDVVFIDDIGQNLRTARQLGMRTVKVNLGRTKEAVRELEEITGMKLIADDKAKL